MRNTRHNDGTTQTGQTTYGIDPDDREQILLDDLRVKIRRLADAVEQQNKLLEAERETTPLDDLKRGES